MKREIDKQSVEWVKEKMYPIIRIQTIIANKNPKIDNGVRFICPEAPKEWMAQPGRG